MIDVCTLFVFVVLTSPVYIQANSMQMHQRQGDSCPKGCQCQPAYLSHTLMARWFNREQNLRATLCVLQQETNIQKLIDQIPSATEMLTILQAPDAPNATVTESMLSRLSKLRGIDFQGSGQNPYKLNLGPCAFRQLHDLQYISLQKINFVGKKVFDGLKSVEVLQISECDIEILLETSC
ncbi:uncharacterized protein LOC143235767 [Tachypleus tridentatus]|uniref:uncharacterized protein LOC143235767 n=1 Tax=Tachypleus tridentatus TaxID=6853 RepID=UPI003FD35F4B